ncbi:MAG TPA: hypothetical protein VKS60_07940 [Stellaceae bacterium]|nr:hypothetical protein [Stellaceae bacterium]
MKRIRCVSFGRSETILIQDPDRLIAECRPDPLIDDPEPTPAPAGAGGSQGQGS